MIASIGGSMTFPVFIGSPQIAAFLALLGRGCKELYSAPKHRAGVAEAKIDIPVAVDEPVEVFAARGEDRYGRLGKALGVSVEKDSAPTSRAPVPPQSTSKDADIANSADGALAI
jgi:hypothetical protein